MSIALAMVMVACSQSPSHRPSPTRSSVQPTSSAPTPILPIAADLPGWFAYTDADSNIWIVAGDGTRRRRLTDSGPGYDFAPSWSPDGRHLVFRSSRGKPPAPGADEQVFVIDRDGTGEHQIAHGLFPAWSPDGSTIAVSGFVDAGISLIDPNGKLVADLTDRNDECATWSPDGRQIAFCRNPLSADNPNDWDVWVMDRDGSNQRRVTTGPDREYPGPWSPDGRWLSFSRGGSGDVDVYTIRAAGKDERRLTSDPGSQAPMAWLPDGRIVFSDWESDLDEDPDWLVMDADGTGRARLPWLFAAFDPVTWWGRSSGSP